VNGYGLPVEAAATLWFTRSREVASLRAGGAADRRVDSLITRLLSSAEPMIVDAALAPWLFSGPAMRIWLGSDRASRAWKCSVSRLPLRLSTDESLRLLDDKDGLTRHYLQMQHGIDLFEDRSCFDVVIDNSHLITEPTRGAADRGIAELHPVLVACVQAYFSGPSDSVTTNWGSSPGYRAVARHTTLEAAVAGPDLATRHI
jgi:cytidylate kinase